MTVGDPKPQYYPGHGQELYDVSDGKYGFDYNTNTAGTVDITSGLVEYHCEWVKKIIGCEPSCLSYRRGIVGVHYAMTDWFLAGRNSSFNVEKSITAYGQSKINNLYLGYPFGYNFTHETAICQSSSSRYWDSWKNPYQKPPYDTRDQALEHCETLLMETISNGGWFNDFTHWHTTDADDLGVFFAGQRRVIGENDVFTGGYGECMQHLFLRDSVKSISIYWEGLVCVIDVQENELPKELPLSVFSIPLSVQVDLTGTALEGKDIYSAESPGIKKLDDDLYSVDVPFNEEEGFQIVKIATTDTPDYLDFQLPNIVSIRTNSNVLTVVTNKPTRLALFWTPNGDPEYEVRILCRCNNLSAEHLIDFNDPSVLNYGGDMTLGNLMNGNIYIGAITETKQSILSDAYHFGDTIETSISSVPKNFKLHTCFPNPFNSSTTLKYELSEQCKILLQIYNCTGQKIRTLVQNTILPGEHSVIWDGTDDKGFSVSSGIYIIRLCSNNYSVANKMILMK